LPCEGRLGGGCGGSIGDWGAWGGGGDEEGSRLTTLERKREGAWCYVEG